MEVLAKTCKEETFHSIVTKGKWDYTVNEANKLESEYGKPKWVK